MLPYFARAGAICAFVFTSFSSSVHAAVTTLGQATDFNVFVLGDISQLNSNTQGRMTAGGNITLLNYGIGSALTNSSGTRDDLIAGANLNYTNGQVMNGNVVFGQTGNLNFVGVPNGTVRQQSGVIDFPAASMQLHNLSQQFGAISPNGTSSSGASGVTLTGSDPTLNVFELTTTELEIANFNTFTINVPVGSTVLVNILGLASNQHDMSFANADSARTVFNYLDASSIQMQSLSMQGSVLAPNADVIFQNGNFFGTLISNNLDGTLGGGTFHHVPFVGVIPEPGALCLVGLAGAFLLSRSPHRSIVSRASR